MTITMNETVATVTNCYRRGRTYDLPAAEGAALVRAGQATSDDPAAADATRAHRQRMAGGPSTQASTPPSEPAGPAAAARAPRQRMDRRPSTPLEPPAGGQTLHPAEQPDQTPADVERAGRTRGPVETVPPTDPAALEPENPLVPAGAGGAKRDEPKPK